MRGTGAILFFDILFPFKITKVGKYCCQKDSSNTVMIGQFLVFAHKWICGVTGFSISRTVCRPNTEPSPVFLQYGVDFISLFNEISADTSLFRPLRMILANYTE
jgi:hypothetical protein